jgi:predicted alpha/beta hydrolase family esterase
MIDKPQVCIIHGGDVYETDEAFHSALAHADLQYERLLYSPSWRNWLAEQLPDHDVLLPAMPNKQNARYDDWSLYFSKIVPHLKPSAVLVGHSLGGIFLAKYFSEHPPVEPFAKLILLAAPYDDESQGTLGDFKLTDVPRLSLAAHMVHIMHSTDDPVVSFSEAERYKTAHPGAVLHRFSDKHHFIDPTFPELLELIH